MEVKPGLEWRPPDFEGHLPSSSHGCPYHFLCDRCFLLQGFAPFSLLLEAPADSFILVQLMVPVGTFQPLLCPQMTYCFPYVTSVHHRQSLGHPPSSLDLWGAWPLEACSLAFPSCSRKHNSYSLASGSIPLKAKLLFSSYTII